MEENKLSGSRGALCVLTSLAVSAGVSLALLLIFALGLCSAPDPASLAVPFGLGALYAGAVAGGFVCSRRLGAGTISGVLSGGGFCTVVFLLGFVCDGGGRPAWVSALLLLGIVAAGALGAYLGRAGRKEKRPSAGRVRRRAGRPQHGARRRRRA